MVRALEGAARRVLRPADAALNRLYGWRYNPIYQSGTLVVLLFLVLLVTGLWLLLFYRVSGPWESVARLSANRWSGNWVRGVHRYASDAALLAAGVHALRMLAQGRSWGPRTLAWVSGVLLVGMFLLCGITGFVMVWDQFGARLAQEGARILDALPILSEPIGRAFTGERPLQGTFFFLNLFIHVALPLGMALGLWLHVTKLARPVLLPPRRLAWSLVALLVLVALLRPIGTAPKASPFLIPGVMPVDWFFGFWLPLTQPLPAGAVWAGIVTTGVIALGFPRWRRRGVERPPPSTVDADICTGCRQCGLDCPYEAITMLPRTDGRADVVASVNPARCVSCGICAGSCAPMGVGPPGRTGRDQVEAIRRFMTDGTPNDGTIVTILCRNGPAPLAGELQARGGRIYPVDCAGNLHTSVIELALRGGAGGVLVVSCPPRDCRNREGPAWLVERMYHDREAELQARVDRRRVAVVFAGAMERGVALDALRQLQQSVAGLAPEAPQGLELDAVCDPGREEAVS